MLKIFRALVAKQLAEAALKLDSNFNFCSWMDELERLAWCIRVAPVNKRSILTDAQLIVSFSDLEACQLLTRRRTRDWNLIAQALAAKFPCGPVLNSIRSTNDGFLLAVEQSVLTEAVLSDVLSCTAQYGRCSDLHLLKLDADNNMVVPHVTGEAVVIEFSSPNIAKPFHCGHLRSTVLGNFIANISECFGQNVIRLNFLGDWGTQFGLLGIGFEKYGNMDALKMSPMQHLYEVYVKINKDADADCSIRQAARIYFCQLEQGDECRVSFWRLCRMLSIIEYSTVYQKLGVSFSHIHGESMYHEAARKLVQKLDTSGLLHRSADGFGYIDLTEPQDNESVYGQLSKSDGSTLYLTRDIVAAIDRWETFSASRLYYVVENGQHLHFKLLLRSLVKLGCLWAEKWHHSKFHVKFGRVEGMSTRHGNVVFLQDLLNEAKLRTLEKLKSAKTTKVSSAEDIDKVSEILGISAVIVHNLKEYRRTNYRFSWDHVLNFNGDSGIFLQYTHARLCSLISRCVGGVSTNEVDFSSLNAEPTAIRIILHLARYDEILLHSYTEFESCFLVRYLFLLGRLVNVALEELRVEGQLQVVAQARLCLFMAARAVIADGLAILGIEPLERI